MNQGNDMQRERCFEAYFCTNFKYYMKVYHNYVEERKFGFNFWAGIFPIMWFIYRKLYYHAIILFLISYYLRSVIHNILEMFFFVFDGDFFVSHIILKAILLVPLGYLSNYFYIKKAIKTIDNCNIEVDEQDFKTILTKLRNLGNVNLVGVIVYFMADLIISIMTML